MALLKLKDIGKIYVSEGNVAVGIRGVNLSFDRGEFVAVTGKSGSGKSTLLNVISGMDSYEEGELFIEGQTTSHYLQPDWENYRQQYISFIFQDYNIIESFTVLQNVELALMHIADPRQRRRRAMELIERVGLKAHVRHKGSRLSGGQKQRTVIARALAKDSPIILADEPTGNLDSATSKEIIDLLQEVSRDKLLIMVTHNFDQVEHCATRHVRIYDGAVEADTVIAQPRKPEGAPAPQVEKKTSAVKNGITLGLSIFKSRPRLSIFLCLLMLVGNLGIFFMTSAVSEAGSLFEDTTMFTPYEGRVVITKQNGEVISQEELTDLTSKIGATSNLHYDLLLDQGRYSSYFDGFFVRLEYTNVNSFSESDMIGRFPEAADEVFLSLPLGCQTYFGKDEILIDTITLERLPFRVVGIHYFIDNNQLGQVLFHPDGFRIATAAYSLLNSSNLNVNVEVKVPDSNRNMTFSFRDVYPFFNMPERSVYIASKEYDEAIRELKRKDPNVTPVTEIGLSASFHRYDNYGVSSSKSHSWVIPADYLTDKDPGTPAGSNRFMSYTDTMVDIDIAYTEIYDSYLAISADYLLELGEEFLAMSYRQASLFFADDKVAENAIEELRSLGYIAVISSEVYTPDPMETILDTLEALMMAFLWVTAIVFIAFFINLCSSRSLSAFKGDMAIMRSMGIPVKVIRIGMYVRMLLSLIPAYLLVTALSVYIFHTPHLNAQFSYLYPWQHALIFLGMLLLTARVTHKQIKKLFHQSVKKALKGGAEA
ncbi:MAG: ATP-binding cassette domain-containing protein [Ruminococcaceae bacterium]|nr:ATP-binding cassette domain-containing protein [Oscillospiraceae bacterium]